jgi:acetate kinase
LSSNRDQLVWTPETAGKDLASGRVVAAHLGNGASLSAMRDGRSVATIMGFTALDGLMMGTRCGAPDPGVVLYLIRARCGAPDPGGCCT